MALDFPANPTNGQVYDSYTYNSAVGAWQAREDSRTVAVLSSTVPSTANPGDIWVNTNDGIAFVYYDDGTSAQWMEMLPSGVPLLSTKANLVGGNAFTDIQSITSTSISQAPLTVNGFVGQTANLQEWKNSSGTVVAAVTPTGSLTGYGSNMMQSFVTTRIPLTVKGSSGQTADLQQWQNSDGTVLSEVDSAGIVTAPRFISTQATGTAPLTVTSTTAVTNLNADLLDGQHGSYYAPITSPSFVTGAAAPQFTNSGFDFILGNGDQVSRGNTGSSRALVKIGTSRLYVNYAGDFSGGTVIDSALAVSGRLTVPNQPAFFAYANAGLWAAQVWIPNVTTVNTGGHYNTSNGRFTAPVAGRYFFTLNAIGYTSGTTRLYPRINGATQLSGFHLRTINTANYGDASLGWIFYLNAGDYVDIYLGEGYNYSDTGGYANWSGFLIG